MRLALLLALLATAAPAGAASARVSEAAARDFVARQSKAWNAGDLAAYFALFTPDAKFTDQARSKDGRIVPYGTSTLSEARAQVRKSRASQQVLEASAVREVRLSPDGKSAVVVAATDTKLTSAGRTRRICAERTMTLVATPAGLRSKGQTDTIAPCR